NWTPPASPAAGATSTSKPPTADRCLWPRTPSRDRGEPPARPRTRKAGCANTRPNPARGAERPEPATAEETCEMHPETTTPNPSTSEPNPYYQAAAAYVARGIEAEAIRSSDDVPGILTACADNLPHVLPEVAARFRLDQ